MNKNWRKAIGKEMSALEKIHKTWEMIELFKSKKSVRCKWVFMVKYKANGTQDRYKAKLVTKGYTQIYGMNYQETFTLVVKMVNTI